MRGHRLFAATYDLATRRGERRILGELRRRVVGQARGQALEIGVGTGANLSYYSRAERIVAIEPDPFMLERARRRAQRLGLPVVFCEAQAEHLPFHDASFDSIVATLVLCTVADPARSLAEARRVLRPGGELRFIEHVRAPGHLAARVQEALTPIWSLVAAGCHLDRRTAEAITMAGFELVELEENSSIPLVPLILGVARRQLET